MIWLHSVLLITNQTQDSHNSPVAEWLDHRAVTYVYIFYKNNALAQAIYLFY